MPGVTNQFVTINPDELRFQFELEKQVSCDLKVANTTDQYVAFKVKTTSPKKYFVRPNTGVIQPWDSCMIRVTLQAQKEYPPDMQSKDKFLLQSTKVSQQTDIDELPPNTFTKESGKVVEDCKLRVVYVFPQSGSTLGEDGLKQSSDFSNMHGSASNDDALQRLRDERDAAVRQTQQLQRDVEKIKKQRSKKNEQVFSFKSSLYVALFGIVAGFLLNVWLSSPNATLPKNAALSSPPTPTPPDTSLSSPSTPAPPTPTPPTDASLSSPPTPAPPKDASSSSSSPMPTPPLEESDESSSSSPPTQTPPKDESDESSLPPAQTPPKDESDESSFSPPTTTTPTDVSSTIPPTDSKPSAPPTE